MKNLDPQIDSKMTELANFLIDRAIYEFNKSKEGKMGIDINNQSNMIIMEHPKGQNSHQYAKQYRN